MGMAFGVVYRDVMETFVCLSLSLSLIPFPQMALDPMVLHSLVQPSITAPEQSLFIKHTFRHTHICTYTHIHTCNST